MQMHHPKDVKVSGTAIRTAPASIADSGQVRLGMYAPLI